jgi:hypothetical protein
VEKTAKAAALGLAAYVGYKWLTKAKAPGLPRLAAVVQRTGQSAAVEKLRTLQKNKELVADAVARGCSKAAAYVGSESPDLGAQLTKLCGFLPKGVDEPDEYLADFGVEACKAYLQSDGEVGKNLATKYACDRLGEVGKNALGEVTKDPLGQALVDGAAAGVACGAIGTPVLGGVCAIGVVGVEGFRADLGPQSVDVTAQFTGIGSDILNRFKSMPQCQYQWEMREILGYDPVPSIADLEKRPRATLYELIANTPKRQKQREYYDGARPVFSDGGSCEIIGFTPDDSVANADFQQRKNFIDSANKATDFIAQFLAKQKAAFGA